MSLSRVEMKWDDTEYDIFLPHTLSLYVLVGGSDGDGGVFFCTVLLDIEYTNKHDCIRKI